MDAIAIDTAKRRPVHTQILSLYKRLYNYYVSGHPEQCHPLRRMM